MESRLFLHSVYGPIFQMSSSGKHEIALMIAQFDDSVLNYHGRNTETGKVDVTIKDIEAAYFITSVLVLAEHLYNFWIRHGRTPVVCLRILQSSSISQDPASEPLGLAFIVQDYLDETIVLSDSSSPEDWQNFWALFKMILGPVQCEFEEFLSLRKTDKDGIFNGLQLIPAYNPNDRDSFSLKISPITN